MTANEFFVRIIDTASDEQILKICAVILIPLSYAKKRDKILEQFGIGEADIIKAANALSAEPKDYAYLRNLLKTIADNAISKINAAAE